MGAGVAIDPAPASPPLISSNAVWRPFQSLLALTREMSRMYLITSRRGDTLSRAQFARFAERQTEQYLIRVFNNGNCIMLHLTCVTGERSRGAFHKLEPWNVQA